MSKDVVHGPRESHDSRQIEPADGALVDLARAGDGAAFDKLVLRYQEPVYRTARRILGSHEDADDAVQEIFLRVLRTIGGFRGESEFSTWLYRIAVNYCLNASRRKKIITMLRLDDLAAGFRDPVDRTAAADEALHETERERILREGVERLPPRQRTVFVLRLFEGKKFDEIAKMLNISTGGVKASFHHAVRKLRDHARRES
jgi:RNA polymerase sigma-70 factor (ECF subfamily)